MGITAKHTWQDYKTNEDILPELKIRPVLLKIQNYINEWVQYVRRMERERETDWHTEL